MPITTSAIQALRKDRKREQRNTIIRSRVRSAIRAGKESKKQEDISAAYSVIDRAVKKNVIHSNKAARLKSRLKVFVKK